MTEVYIERDSGVQRSGGGKIVKLKIYTFKKIKSDHSDLTFPTSASISFSL